MLVFSRYARNDNSILQFFDLVWGSDSVREKKPSPVPVLDMMQYFQVSKSETLLIGDSNFDVEAGKSAGIKVVAVTYGFRSREYLTKADEVIDNFEQLIEVIPRI